MNNETVEILRKINRCSTIEEARDIIFDAFSNHSVEDDTEDDAVVWDDMIAAAENAEADDWDNMIGYTEFVTYRNGEPVHFAMRGSHWKKIDNFIKNFQKWEAIKLFRKITGWGLMESKHAIEDDFAPPD
jgi:ribosomal protein L7/L12